MYIGVEGAEQRDYDKPRKRIRKRSKKKELKAA